MLRLTSIRLQNFRSFKDATIEFPDRGLLLLRGENGAGKTSILLGIAYVLDLLPTGFPAADMEPWDGSGKPQVTLNGHLADGTKVVWQRGKKTAGQVGNDKVASSKGLAEQQRRVFGCSPEVLRPLVYRPQRRGGLFLGLEPATKFEFLTEVLGLKSMLEAVETAEDRVRELQPKHGAAAVTATQADLHFKTLETQPPTVPPVRPPLLFTEYNDAVAAESLAAACLDELKRQLHDKQQAANVALRTKRTTAEDFRAQLSRIDTAARDAYNRAEYQARMARDAESYRLRDVERDRKLISDLDRQIIQLEAQTCPTCEQPWNQADVKLEVAKKTRKTLQVSVDAESGPRPLSPPPPTPPIPDPRIQKLADAVAQLDNDIQESFASVDTHPDVVVTQALVAKCAQETRFQQQLKRTRELEDAQLAGQRQAALAQYVAWEKQAAQQKTQVEKLYADLKLLDDEMKAEQEFAAALGRQGFLGRVFSEVLDEIAADANARLQRLANAQSISLDMSVDEVRGRQQVKLSVFVNGHECRYETGLSGGMQASVEQVVDLAVMDAVGRRVGGLPGWLCWDEAFDGQAGKTRETSLELLAEFAQDRLVVVVDHHSETKEAFQQVVDVRLENGHSLVS